MNERIRSDWEKRKAEIVDKIFFSILNCQPYLPTLESDARVEAGIIEHPRVHEGHGQIRHTREFYHAVDLHNRKEILVWELF